MGEVAALEDFIQEQTALVEPFRQGKEDAKKAHKASKMTRVSYCGVTVRLRIQVPLKDGARETSRTRLSTLLKHRVFGGVRRHKRA